MAQDPRHPGSILVVEDNRDFRTAMRMLLGREHHAVQEAGNAAEALDLLERQSFDLVLLDLGLPDLDGLELLLRLHRVDEDVAIIVLTGRGDIETVVEAMKRGAENFLVKPVERDPLLAAVDRAIATSRLRVRARSSSAERSRSVVGEPVGDSKGMRNVRDLARRVAETDASVVITGGSGTGKGLVAQMIHRLSRRSAAAFLDLNCAALPPQFLESELFGHERGAFTDAHEAKMGLLEVAHGGTVFLDEIAELDPVVQSKLLKALEDRRFRRLGGIRDISVDVRLIVATSADLRSRVEEGVFRKDLFYRLNVFEIVIPDLRERHEDILPIALHLVNQLNPVVGRRIVRIDPAAVALMESYPWPGNVRELRNVVERAMILARGDEISPQHLPTEIHRPSAAGTGHGELRPLAEVEADHIRQVLAATDGNMKRAAAALGIARSTLYRKLSEHGIEEGR